MGECPRSCSWSEEVWVAQLCPDLCDPVDFSPPGSSVHGILQAGALEWAAILFSRGSSWPRDWTQVSCIAGVLFTTEPPEIYKLIFCHPLLHPIWHPQDPFPSTFPWTLSALAKSWGSFSGKSHSSHQRESPSPAGSPWDLTLIFHIE